ncbi:MAG: DUF5947 family protein [Methylocella sp.]
MTGVERMVLSTRPGNWVTNVQRFVRPREVAEERCELCAAPISAGHRHLVEPAKHRLLCVCRACVTLLGNRDDTLYREVPEYVRWLENFCMTDADWEAFGIPIGLAFFVQSTPDRHVVAFYPGPAGPTESLLDQQAWTTLAANNPILAELEPDSEALLVNRVNNAREYFQAPIDRCYALAGLIRTKWRGLSGGDEAWKAINGFFAELREQHASAGVYRHG